MDFALKWLVEKEVYLRIPLAESSELTWRLRVSCVLPPCNTAHVMVMVDMYIFLFFGVPFLDRAFHFARLATHAAFVDGIALPILNPEAMMRCKTWRDHSGGMLHMLPGWDVLGVYYHQVYNDEEGRWRQPHIEHCRALMLSRTCLQTWRILKHEIHDYDSDLQKNILHNSIRSGWRNSTRGRDRVGWWNLFWARNACTKSACCAIVACGLHEGWKL